MKETFSRTQNKHYTYKLAYPSGFVGDDGIDLSGIVFYVGKGTVMYGAITQRIDHHEYEAGTGCMCEKCIIIRMIWTKGLQVSKDKMLETNSETEALLNEKVGIQETYAGPYLINRRLNKPRAVSTTRETEDERKARLAKQKLIWKYLRNPQDYPMIP